MCRRSEIVQDHGLTCRQQWEKEPDADLIECDSNMAYAALKKNDVKLIECDGNMAYTALEESDAEYNDNTARATLKESEPFYDSLSFEK